MGGKSDPPPAPDYVGAAQAQGSANKDAAIAQAQLANPNIYGPYGSSTVSYSLDPTTGNPVPTINQNLSSNQQALLNNQDAVKMGLANLGNESIGRVQNVMGQGFNYNGPSVQTGVDTSGVAKAPVNSGTTALQASMQRLQPTLERQRDQLNTQLVNQGLRPGMEAYTNSMKDQDFRENDLYNQAVSSSLGMDMSANQQGYNQALQSGQFGNTAQAQALAQALYQRELPLNEVSSLMSGSQVNMPTGPQYQGAQVQSSPVFGGLQSMGKYNTDIYNAQTGQENATTNSAVTAAAMYAMYAY